MKNWDTIFKRIIMCSLVALASHSTYGTIFLAVSFEDGSIDIYEQKNNNLKPISATKCFASIRSIAISKKNRAIATASTSRATAGGLCIWENTDKGLRMTQKLYKRDHSFAPFPTSVTYNKDGMLISGFFDGTIRTWEQKKDGQFKLKQMIDKNFAGHHTAPISSVACNKDGFLITRSGDRVIKIWQPKNGLFYLKQTANIDFVPYLSLVAFDNTEFLASESEEDNTIKIWQLNGDNQFKLFQELDNNSHNNSIKLTAIAINKDGVLVVGYSNGTIKIWEQKRTNNQFELVQTLDKNCNGHASEITSLTLKDGFLLSGSKQGEIKIWEKYGQFQIKKTMHTKQSSHSEVRASGLISNLDTFKPKLLNNTNYTDLKIKLK